MNNTIGLEDGRWIRFVNVGNGSVIELSDRNALVCRPLNPDREEFQKFRCIFKGPGRFCIAAKYQPSEEYTMVWDYLPHRRLLIQKRLTDASWNTQIWSSGHVPGTESLYFVLSALEETSCLKNVGNGKQVLIVRKTDQVTADKFAQWQLEQLGPIT